MVLVVALLKPLNVTW